jgi:hypothetical protein
MGAMNEIPEKSGLKGKHSSKVGEKLFGRPKVVLYSNPKLFRK